MLSVIRKQIQYSCPSYIVLGVSTSRAFPVVGALLVPPSPFFFGITTAVCRSSLFL